MEAAKKPNELVLYTFTLAVEVDPFWVGTADGIR
jgi:hypothetical protein